MSPHDPTPYVIGTGITIIALIWLIGGLITLVGTIFWIVEIVDVVRREFPDPNLKIVWILIVILFHFVGALVYYFVGKPQGTLPQYPNQNRF